MPKKDMIKLTMLSFSDPDPEGCSPNYQNRFSPTYYFSTEELARVWEKNTEHILNIVESELRDYINDDLLCNDLEDMFPKRSVLTGEWYICAVSFYDDNDMLSVDTALLGYNSCGKDDYLGLEVHLKYIGGGFEVYGVDSCAR